MTEFLCENRNDFYNKVTKRCEHHLTKSIDEKGFASFIVPGGTTPAPIFKKLSHLNLKWEKVSVIPSDERWIDVSSEQSNQRLIKENLLINEAKKSKFIGLKNNSPSAAEGEKITQEKLKQLDLPFNIVMLGMGNDGHFASLFPGCPQLSEALDIASEKLCSAINANGCSVAGEFTERMSLTLSAILNSQLIIILITGKEKLKVMREAIKETNFMKKPIAALLTQTKTPVEVYWVE